jgi:hypothetical protein
MPTILGFLVAKRNSCIQQLGDIRRDRARVVLTAWLRSVTLARPSLML